MNEGFTSKVSQMASRVMAPAIPLVVSWVTLPVEVFDQSAYPRTRGSYRFVQSRVGRCIASSVAQRVAAGHTHLRIIEERADLN